MRNVKKSNRQAQDREMIRIFRQYARLGLDGARLSVAEKYLLLERLWTSEPTRREMLAAHDALRMLRLSDDNETLKAVCEIYLRPNSLGQPLGRAETGERVAEFAREHYCDPRTVYRRLERARKALAAVMARATEEENKNRADF